ncbi:hypothetical protein SAXI111661_10075 [Saccharomonospora xinjiangensis]|uniref:hypothetical protein n=1 Tax=Saccharomonospora xinjiangensis TaxID=75294 RepID=UPI00106F40E5|nr:hypothetical protein [Saccharomonospora xinjiangensis]QBQ59946.1 hypothetical protein EYD13_07925 [Saccharomonospora xinjiangensis]
MPINATIRGNPASVSGVAEWLRSRFSDAVTAGASQIYAARNDAEAGWNSSVGEDFRQKMTEGARKTDDLAVAATNSAQSLDDYAVGLRRLREDMERIRAQAAVAGLEVDGGIIRDPGPAPPDPGRPPVGPAATEVVVVAHRQATAEWNAYANRIRAYAEAETQVAQVRRAQEFLDDTLQNAWNDVKSKWFITIGDLANGAVESLRAVHSSILLRESGRLADDAARFMAQATSTSGVTPDVVYRDVDTARTMANQADDLARESADAKAAAGRLALKTSGALAAAGVVYDIAVADKPVGQAFVSGAGGFAASVGAGVATGALVGSAIPVPGVGTVAGAVVGAVVGVFTSGAIDSLYQNGIGALGDAVEAGAEAVGDTVEAIGDAAGAVGDAIGDAWDAVF